jgi:hypothetical protein
MTQSETTNNTVAPTYDPETLKTLEKIVGAETTRLFIQQFIRSATEHLANLQQWVATGNANELRREAHQFKGESLQLGAMQLGILCEEMETLAQQDSLEKVPENLAQQIEAEFAHFKATLKSGGQL